MNDEELIDHALLYARRIGDDPATIAGAVYQEFVDENAYPLRHKRRVYVRHDGIHIQVIRYDLDTNTSALLRSNGHGWEWAQFTAGELMLIGDTLVAPTSRA